MTQANSIQTTAPGRESIDQFAARMSTRFSLSAGIIVGLLVVLLNFGRNPVPMLEDLRSFAIIGFLAMIPITLISAGWGFVLGIQYALQFAHAQSIRVFAGRRFRAAHGGGAVDCARLLA